MEEIDTLLAQTVEAQRKLSEITSKQLADLQEARRQQILVALNDFPDALYIGQARNIIHTWSLGGRNHPIQQWLESHGRNQGQQLYELQNWLDAIAEALYYLKKEGIPL